MVPPHADFGGMNESFEPQGHPRGRRGGPHRRGRGPPQASGFDNSHLDPSFEPGEFQPQFQPGQPQDFQPPFQPGFGPPDLSEGMMQPRRGRMRHGPPGPGQMDMDMPPAIDMDAQMQDDGGMNGLPGTQGPFGAGPSFDDPSFGRPPLGLRHGRLARMSGAGVPEGNFGIPPPDGFGGPTNQFDQDGEPDFTGPPQGLPSMHGQDQDMGFQPNSAFGAGPQDSFTGPPGHLPRRARRASEGNLPPFRPQNQFPLNEPFGLQATRFADHGVFDDGDDSERTFGSDPTDDRRHRWDRRTSYDPSSVPTSGYSGSRSRTRRKQILFYDQRKPYFGFSNKSPYPITYRNRKYPTAEHLYHAMKVTAPISQVGLQLKDFPFS